MNIDKKFFYTGCALIMFYFACLNIDNIFNFIGQVIMAMSPFLWAGVFILVLNPIVVKLNKKINNEKISATLAVILFVLLLANVLILIIPQIVTSATQLISVLKNCDFELIISEATNYLQLDVKTVDSLEKSLSEMSGNLISLIQNAIPSLMSATMNIANNIINFLTGMVITWYILSEKTKVKNFTNKIIESVSFLKDKHQILSLWRMSIEKFNMFFSGKVVDSLIVGIICLVFMLITKMDYAILISLIICITNIIPFFGPFIGAVPSIFILLIIDPLKALIFAVFILVLQQVDGNFIGPKIIGDSVGVSKIGIIFAIVIGGNLFGVIGMIVGVPVLAVVWEVVSSELINSKSTAEE